MYQEFVIVSHGQNTVKSSNFSNKLAEKCLFMSYNLLISGMFHQIELFVEQNKQTEILMK